MSLSFIDLKPQYEALKDRINQRLQKVLDHGQFILGPEVQECEQALANYVDSSYCLTAASGTDALMMILMGLGIGRGDEVVTTSFSFFATAEVISLVGATPVFVDIDPATYNLNVKLIEPALTPRTKAIMPVSLYGQPADFDEINELARKAGCVVIEDAAQSFGAPYKGKRSCNLSEVAATSFFPAKPLGCYGDGGAVFTSNSELFERVKQIRVHGQQSRYHHVSLGINGRLDTLQCAILLEKLSRYDWELEKRQAVAMRYHEAFAHLEAKGRLKLPRILPDRGSVWAQYTIAVEDRDGLARKLSERGVPSSVHYPSALHCQPVYAELRGRFHLPQAEAAAARVLSLPMYPDLAVDDQIKIINAVQECLA